MCTKFFVYLIGFSNWQITMNVQVLFISCVKNDTCYYSRNDIQIYLNCYDTLLKDKIRGVKEIVLECSMRFTNLCLKNVGINKVVFGDAQLEKEDNETVSRSCCFNSLLTTTRTLYTEVWFAHIFIYRFPTFTISYQRVLIDTIDSN